MAHTGFDVLVVGEYYFDLVFRGLPGLPQLGADLWAREFDWAPGAAYATTLALTDSSGWCPIERKSFASTLHANVYVIGDASIADAMPKSGFSANNQAKVVARTIVEELAGRPLSEPLWENTCYALAGKDYGLFVADVFRVVDGKIARINGKSRYLPLNASPAQIKLGARYQQAWLRTFTEDCFA